MASVQVDGPEVEEVNSHVEEKSTNKCCSCEPQNIEKQEHHDYVEQEEDPEDSDNITPDHDHDHEKEEKPDEDEEELVMGSHIVDDGEKPTGGIEFSDEEELDDD